MTLLKSGQLHSSGKSERRRAPREPRLSHSQPNPLSCFPVTASPILTFGWDVEEHRVCPGPIPGERGGLDPGRVVPRVEPVKLGAPILPVLLS